MRKFTFFLAMMVAMVTTSMAQSYELTETRLTSSDLNSKTESTLIAIKNLSATNNYWFVGNTGAVPYSAAEFSEDAVFVWEPVVPGVPGAAYCLKKLDGTYMTTVSPAEFSAESGAAALFKTTNPTVANGQFNGDGDSMPYIDDEALLVRFTNAAGTWINVQNGEAGTPVYNNGTGGWTIHNVYLVEEKEETVEPEPEPTVQTFAVEAALFPTPQGDVTEIKGIRVEANQGPSLSDLPTGWTFTNEAGEEFEMHIQWMYDFEEIFISFNPSITEAGTYTLTIPAGSLKTDDGKECEAATFSWTIEATVVEPEPEPEPAATAKIYHITAKDAARGALYATAESTHLTHCGATYGNYHNQDIAVNAEDVNQQFAFIEYKGATYFYSLGAKKFASKEKQYIKLTEIPEGFATVEDADAEGYKIILLNGENRINFSGGYEHGCVANWETPDDGNRLLLTEVGSFDPTELIAEVEAKIKAKEEALAAARAAFDAKYAEAQAILAEAALSVVESELPLQVTDATAAAYIWSNKPEPNEGPIAQLVDGIAEEGNFFHTNWSDGNNQPKYHYIEVDLGEGNGLAEFSFKYTTRFAVANDYPDGIQVLGSNDKENYTELYNVTSGLPQTGGTLWTSNIVSSETAYRYLRFNVDAERTYWHMSEFDIVTSEISVAEKYAAVAKSVVALDNAFKAAAENADYTEEELNAAVAAMSAAIEAINAGVATPEPELPALEITGYTPTEAVESLETITITFNDEIEGTFDMMAMSQIYLGSRSNGCSFAVEGNVLTITPFNAITTPGEYALVIPEGLITRKANGEAIALNGEITFTVAEPVVEPTTGIEAGKLYRIKASNGEYLTIGDSNANTHGHVHGATLDETNNNQVFTFIAVEGQENTYYVQSVAGKYFSYEGVGAGWNVNATEDATQAHALTFEAVEGKLQYIIKCYNAAKYGYKYFKYEYVSASGKSHPYNDADIDKAEVWTLEEVAAAEPELPALEITGYTPTEAVESLETITITFNDEIEGTFDVMAMSQIYLGAKSNGCSFAVEGNVLTITPFNAITTPGEYALVIPEGLITRKANGEAISLNGEITFTVKEPTVPVVITSVDQLSNSKLYTIVSSDLGRGGMFAGEGASLVDMCGVTYNQAQDCHSIAMDAADPRQQFAFVEYEGKHYLYSVSEKKFVAKNGNVNKLTAEAPFEFVVVESVSENTFALMLNGTHYMTASPGWCSNAERNTCIQTTLTDHNSDNGWDSGAWFTITEVGEFDATEAIAMLTPAEPEVKPLEVVSISPADGATVEKLEQIVVTFNAPVTLDETKNINLVAIEGSDVTPIEAYVGTWQLFSSFPEQEGYFVTGTTEIIEYQGQPALLCKGFADMASYGYDDSFIMYYNSEDGSVTLPAQKCEYFEYYGVSYEVGLYIGNSTEKRIFNGKLIGNYVDGVIIFEGSPENEQFSDSFMFYSPDLGTISFFNDIVWMPVSQAAAPAKAAVRNNFKVEFAKNLSVATIAKSKISRAEENVASIVSASINPDDATQLIITVNQALANDTYKLVIEAGAVVTAEGATNETIICTYILNDPTGIEGIDAEVEQTIYDLTGRKIETITKSGIYIVNGKKVLVK